MAEVRLSRRNIDYKWDTRESPVKGQFVEIVTPLIAGITIRFYLQHMPRGMHVEVLTAYEGWAFPRIVGEQGVNVEPGHYRMTRHGNEVLFEVHPFARGWGNEINIVYMYKTVNELAPDELKKNRRQISRAQGKNGIYERLISRKEETFAYLLQEMPQQGSVKVRRVDGAFYQELPPPLSDDDLLVKQFRVYYSGQYKQLIEVHTELPDATKPRAIFLEITYQKEPPTQTAAEAAAEAKRLEEEKKAAEERKRLEAEAARLERERLARLEAERIERERLAAIKKAEEEKAAEEKRIADEEKRLEEERIAAEQKAEADRLEAERIERERIAAEQIERDRIAKEKADEAARLERERIANEAARLEQERLEKELLDALQKAEDEKKRIAAEEAARLERERLEAAGTIELTDTNLYTKIVNDNVTDVTESVSLVVEHSEEFLNASKEMDHVVEEMKALVLAGLGTLTDSEFEAHKKRLNELQEQMKSLEATIDKERAPVVTKLLRFKLRRIPGRGRIIIAGMTEVDGDFGASLIDNTFRVQYDGAHTGVIEFNLASNSYAQINYIPAAAILDTELINLRKNPLSKVTNYVDLIDTVDINPTEIVQEFVLRERPVGDVKVYDKTINGTRRKLTNTSNDEANDGEYFIDVKRGMLAIRRFPDSKDTEQQGGNLAIEWTGSGRYVDSATLNSIWRGKNKSMTHIVQRKFTINVAKITDDIMLNGKLITYGDGKFSIFEKNEIDTFIKNVPRGDELKAKTNLENAWNEEMAAEVAKNAAGKKYAFHVEGVKKQQAWVDSTPWPSQATRDTLKKYEGDRDNARRKLLTAKNQYEAAQKNRSDKQREYNQFNTPISVSAIRSTKAVHAAPMVIVKINNADHALAVYTNGNVATSADGETWAERHEMKLPDVQSISNAATVVMGHYLYLIGGECRRVSRAGGIEKHRVWRWNLKVPRNWELMADLPIESVNNTAAVHDGKIYVIGGGFHIKAKTPIRDLVYYTPENNTWAIDDMFQQSMQKVFGGMFRNTGAADNFGNTRALEVNNALWIFGGIIMKGSQIEPNTEIIAYKNGKVSKAHNLPSKDVFGVSDTGRNLFILTSGMSAMIQKPEENFAIEIGKGAETNNLLSIAIGTNAKAGAFKSVAFGINAVVTEKEENYIMLGDESTTVKTQNGSITTSSDRRDKADIQPSNLGLEFVNKLQPSMYRMALDARTGARRHFGFIAQDILALQQEMLKDEANLLFAAVKQMGNGRLAIDYREFIPVLIKAVQELADKIDAVDTKRKHLTKVQ